MNDRDNRCVVTNCARPQTKRQPFCAECWQLVPDERKVQLFQSALLVRANRPGATELFNAFVKLADCEVRGVVPQRGGGNPR
jgi:hypothetical protein